MAVNVRGNVLASADCAFTMGSLARQIEVCPGMESGSGSARGFLADASSSVLVHKGSASHKRRLLSGPPGSWICVRPNGERFLTSRASCECLHKSRDHRGGFLRLTLKDEMRSGNRGHFHLRLDSPNLFEAW